MPKFDRSFLNNQFYFKCQGSGKCCVSRGSYGYVYLTLGDRKKMAQELGLDLKHFTRQHCQSEDGIYFLKETKDQSGECRFLDKDSRCRVYRARPTQCRTWPFWPENMNAKTWTKEIAVFCPGVGKGAGVSSDHVKQQLQLQRESEEEIFDPQLYDLADWQDPTV